MRVIYFLGYSHARGFGSIAIDTYRVKKFEDFTCLIEYAKKEILKSNSIHTYEEIAIISISEFPIPQKKEWLINKLRYFWNLIIGGENGNRK